MPKRKLGVYWAAACGGCDVSILDTDAKILDLAANFDLVMWPCAADFKYDSLNDFADGEVDVFLVNGAFRTSEQVEIAELIRKKTKTVIAYGACACFGGIPSLANLTNRRGIFDKVYKTTFSTDNPKGLYPQTRFDVPEGEVELPEFYNTVRALDQVVPVDYYIPGCPPPYTLVTTAIDALISGQLPPPGSVIAGDKNRCDECTRKRDEKKVKEFHRVYATIPDPEKCLLEQGVVCLGPATRSGCGNRCLNANMPCRGCFGPAPEVHEQGMKVLSALTSIVDSKDAKEVGKIVDGIPDPTGTIYRFSMAKSFLHRRNMNQASNAKPGSQK
jgi:F420-non-reducing hydrogenase small subunit